MDGERSPEASHRRERSSPTRNGNRYSNALPVNVHSMSSSSNSTGSIFIKDTVTRTRQIFSSSVANIGTGSPHHMRPSNSRAHGRENQLTPTRMGRFPSNVLQSGNITRTPTSQGTPQSSFSNSTPSRYSNMHQSHSRSSSMGAAGLNSISPDLHTITIQEMNDEDDDDDYDMASNASGPVAGRRDFKDDSSVASFASGPHRNRTPHRVDRDQDDSSVASFASGPQNRNRPSHRLDRAHRANTSSARRSTNKYKYMPKIRAGRVVQRTRPGEKAALEIRKLRKTTHLLIQKLPFQRVVRQVVQEVDTGDYRFTAEALAALQEVSEQFLVTVFEDSNRAAMHAKRKTVMVQDMQLVRQLQRW